MITIEESKQIAATILEQLGGKQFVVMTGSHHFTCENTTLTMRLTRNKSGATYLRITLNSMDLYDMEFFRWTSTPEFKLIPVAKHEGVYNDMLQDIFEEVTGLYTTLGKRS